MDEATETAFRTELRLHMLERLVVRALYWSAAAAGESAPDTRRRLLEHLQGSAKTLTKEIGAKTREPAQTAFYDDVAERVENSLIALVKKLPEG